MYVSTCVFSKKWIVTWRNAVWVKHLGADGQQLYRLPYRFWSFVDVGGNEICENIIDLFSWTTMGSFTSVFANFKS